MPTRVLKRRRPETRRHERCRSSLPVLRNHKSSSCECEACHDAQVRYYCTNHKPGRWLDSRSCPQCGSQFGVPDPPAPPPSRLRHATSPAPPTSTARSPSPAASSGRKGYTSWRSGGPWGGRKLPGRERETPRRSDAFRDALERGLPELLREAARARRTREVLDPPPIGVAATGCLRAALLLLLLFMLAFLAMPLLLGAFIQ
jgi:hypothetical protein